MSRALFPCPHCGHSITRQDAAGYRILGPETTAMDRIEIAKAIYHATPRNKPFERLSAFKRERLLAEADAFLASLSAAGYRIVGPDEVDPVTLERAAEVAANWGSEIPAEIRALGRKA